MPRLRIFLSSVWRGIPSLAAAPVGPEILPLLCASASSTETTGTKRSNMSAQFWNHVKLTRALVAKASSSSFNGRIFETEQYRSYDRSSGSHPEDRRYHRHGHSCRVLYSSVRRLSVLCSAPGSPLPHSPCPATRRGRYLRRDDDRNDAEPPAKTLQESLLAAARNRWIKLFRSL